MILFWHTDCNTVNMVEFNSFTSGNTRTAGYQSGQYKTVQAWKTKSSTSSGTALPSAAPAHRTAPVKQQILADLESAATGKVGAFKAELETGMAYAGASSASEPQQHKTEEGYQFADVIDVINPLQHLPVVSMVYRELTGDQIHPMSQILGGALFGGPVGAVSGTINAISTMQTGRDIGGHALAMVGIGGEIKESNPAHKYNPEAALNNVAKNMGQNAPLDEMPGSALSFVNLSEPNKAYQRMRVADGRTAGSMIVEKQVASYQKTQSSGGLTNLQKPSQAQEVNFETLPPREEITSVNISQMPKRREI